MNSLPYAPAADHGFCSGYLFVYVLKLFMFSNASFWCAQTLTREIAPRSSLRVIASDRYSPGACEQGHACARIHTRLFTAERGEQRQSSGCERCDPKRVSVFSPNRPHPSVLFVEPTRSVLLLLLLAERRAGVAD